MNQILTARLAQVNWDDAGKPGAGGSVGGSRGPALPATSDASEWEISEAQLNFHDKIASGAFGVLYRGHYCGQEVAIKVLKSGEKASQEEVHREVAQEPAFGGKCGTRTSCSSSARDETAAPVPRDGVHEGGGARCSFCTSTRR